MLFTLILFFLLSLGSAQLSPCPLQACQGSFNLSSEACSSLSSAQSLVSQTISGPCAYLVVKFLCTVAGTAQALSLPSAAFPPDACLRLQNCLMEPEALTPFCSFPFCQACPSSFVPVPNSTLEYDALEAAPFNQAFAEAVQAQPCPKVDRFYIMPEAEQVQQLKFLFGESFYLLDLSQVPQERILGLSLLTLVPARCAYSSYAFNGAESPFVLAGTVSFICLVLISSIVYVLRRNKTPLKQRGLTMQLLNNLCLASGMWTVLEVDTFGYTASCGSIIFLANLILPMIALINLSKGIQLFLVYSWEKYKSSIDISKKDGLIAARSSFLYKVSGVLSEKGSLILLGVLGIPAYILFLAYAITYHEDFSGPLISRSSCSWWTLDNFSPTFSILTPIPPLVPNLSSCQVCSFTNQAAHIIPSLILIVSIASALILILIKIRKMRDHYYIWRELVLVSFVNLAVYPIGTAVVYPDVYAAFVSQSARIDTPALIFSLFLVFNLIFSTAVPIYLSFRAPARFNRLSDSVIANNFKGLREDIKEDIVEKIVTVSPSPTPSSLTANKSYLVPYDPSQTSSTHIGRVNNFVNPFISITSQNRADEALLKCLGDEGLLTKFRLFCQQRFETEILNCYLELVKLQTLPVEERYPQAIKVYDAYFDQISPLYISLLSPFSEEIGTKDQFLEKVKGKRLLEPQSLLYEYLLDVSVPFFASNP